MKVGRPTRPATEVYMVGPAEMNSGAQPCSSDSPTQPLWPAGCVTCRWYTVLYIPQTRQDNIGHANWDYYKGLLAPKTVHQKCYPLYSRNSFAPFGQFLTDTYTWLSLQQNATISLDACLYIILWKNVIGIHKYSNVSSSSRLTITQQHIITRIHRFPLVTTLLLK